MENDKLATKETRLDKTKWQEKQEFTRQAHAKKMSALQIQLEATLRWNDLIAQYRTAVAEINAGQGPTPDVEYVELLAIKAHPELFAQVEAQRNVRTQADFAVLQADQEVKMAESYGFWD